MPNRAGFLFKVLSSVALAAASIHAAETIRHVKIYAEPGRFGGWPANHGVWAWGDEILVGFSLGYYQVREGHHIDHDRPEEHVLARSRDGGKTWKLEHPAEKHVLVGTAGMRHGTIPPGQHE